MKTAKRFKAFLRGERGVSALEYAILVGVIVVGVVAALNAFSDQITAALTAIGGDIGGIEGPDIPEPGGGGEGGGGNEGG